MAKRHPLEVFRDSQKQSTTSKNSPSSGGGLGALLGSFSRRKSKEAGSGESTHQKSTPKKPTKNAAKSEGAEDSFRERAAAAFNRVAGGRSGANSGKATGGARSKKSHAGVPRGLGEYRPLLLLGTGAILALLSAGFVGYKVGFNSGLDSANLKPEADANSILGKSGQSDSPRLSNEWRDPSLNTPELGNGTPPDANFLPFRVLVREFWIETGKPEEALWYVQSWRQELLESGFDHVEIAKSEGAYNLYCGHANKAEDLTDLLDRIKAVEAKEAEDGPFVLAFKQTARIVQDDLR